MTRSSIYNAVHAATLQMHAEALGVDVGHLKMAAARHETLQDLEHGRVLALLGDIIYTKAGSEGCFGQQLYSRLWKQADWHASFDDLVQPVQKVLGQVHIKSALLRGGDMALAGAVAKGGGVGSFLASLVMGGALAGSGLGALNWHLKRETQQDDDQNEELKSRADFYRDTARQINDELQMKQLVQPHAPSTPRY